MIAAIETRPNTNLRMARPGNRNAAGPHNTRQAQFQRLFRKCVSPKTLRKVVYTLAAKAREGDRDSMELLLAYCVGKPVQPSEVKLSGGLTIAELSEEEIERLAAGFAASLKGANVR